MKKRLYFLILLIVSLFLYRELRSEDLSIKQLEELYFRVIVVKNNNEAEKIISDLKKGIPFYSLAREKSIAPSAKNGGYIGKIGIDDIAPKYLKELINLNEGDYSGVIKTSSGYTIFQRTTGKYFKNGIDAFLNNDYEKAINKFKIDISLNPDNINSYKYLAIIFIEKGLFDEAIATNLKIIDINPEDYEAYNNLGNSFMKIGLYKKAQENYKKGIEIVPDNDIIYNNLAWLYASTKDNLDEGISLVKKAIAINPNIAEYHDTLGELYYQKGIHSKAIDEIRTALWLDSDNKDYKEKLNKFENIYKEEINKRIKTKDVKPNIEESDVRPKVIVLNGNGIKDSAKKMVKALKDMGYNVAGIKDAKNFNYLRTTILYKEPFSKVALDIGHKLKGIQEVYSLKEESKYDIWVIVGKK